MLQPKQINKQIDRYLISLTKVIEYSHPMIEDDTFHCVSIYLYLSIEYRIRIQDLLSNHLSSSTTIFLFLYTYCLFIFTKDIHNYIFSCMLHIFNNNLELFSTYHTIYTYISRNKNPLPIHLSLKRRIHYLSIYFQQRHPLSIFFYQKHPLFIYQYQRHSLSISYIYTRRPRGLISNHNLGGLYVQPSYLHIYISI